jgi:hypothetical protein
MTTKAQRRKLHASINTLSGDQVAAIVRQNFPRLKAARADEMANAVIARAHRQVSPRQTR